MVERMYMLCRGLEVGRRISTIKLLHPNSICIYAIHLGPYCPICPSRHLNLSTLDINPFLAPVSRLSQLIHPVAFTLYCKVEHGEQRRRNDHQEGVNAVGHFGNRLGLLEVGSEMGDG